jgi:HD superfamily phosphodiesterase
MARRREDFAKIVESRYPGLVTRVRTLVEQSEAAYNESPRTSESFLWEHTTYVASLAARLSRAEKTDPLAPVLAALFHDAGKFAGGLYHEGDRAEEDDAARLAEKLLGEAGANRPEIGRVAAGLRALYRQGARRNIVADLVHDADFLSKFGTLGAAQFFTKSTLRGRTLRSAITASLSKELTYAACLAENMRTRAGRAMAAAKSRSTSKFFRALFRELAEAGAGDFAVRTFDIRPPGRKRLPVRVRLVVPKRCPACGGRWTFAFRTSRGLKCEKLEADIVCERCRDASNIAFCLPEIAGRTGR